MRRTRGQNIASSSPLFCFVVVHRQDFASLTHKRFGGRTAPSSQPGPALGRGGRPAPAGLPARATGCHAGRNWPGPGGGRRPVVAAHGRVAGGGTPRLGTQKKRSRCWTRPGARGCVAPPVCGSPAGKRRGPFHVRGRDEHHPDLQVPLHGGRSSPRSPPTASGR